MQPSPRRCTAREGGLVVAVLVVAALVQNKASLGPYVQWVGERDTHAAGDAGRSAMSQRLPSPACKPHFRLALSDGNWTEATKFKRLYFYHVRKAGGTNLRTYFRKVAAHHGIEFRAVEYDMAEDPGSQDEGTLYVTHLREPVSRSISHFKYEGRWDCKQLVNNETFIPTEENANTLETWNQSFGHNPSSCRYKKREPVFRMGQCAVNCNIQWFSGLSCPWWDPPKHPEREERPIRREVPLTQQYSTAMRKLLRYNFIVITEKLKDPEYAAAVERFFGVPGVAKRANHPWCEVESHYSNEVVPLEIRNDTLERLTLLNKQDILLYHEMKDCLDGGVYDFPSWDPTRFATNETQQLNYTLFPYHPNPHTPSTKWLARFNSTKA